MCGPIALTHNLIWREVGWQNHMNQVNLVILYQHHPLPPLPLLPALHSNIKLHGYTIKIKFNFRWDLCLKHCRWGVFTIPGVSSLYFVFTLRTGEGRGGERGYWEQQPYSTTDQNTITTDSAPCCSYFLLSSAGEISETRCVHSEFQKIYFFESQFYSENYTEVFNSILDFI